MKLSMWIISDYLRKYHPKEMIKNGRMDIRNVRISSKKNNISPATLQLSREDNDSGHSKGSIICSHNNDILQLESTDTDEVLNEVMDCFDYYNAWEDACLDCIEKQGSLQDMMDISRDYFRNMVLVSDSHMMLLSYIEPRDMDSSVLSESRKQDLQTSYQILAEKRLPNTEVNALQERHRFQSALRDHSAAEIEYSASGRYSCPVIKYPLRFRSQIWGYLVEVCHFTDPSQSDRDIITSFGGLLEKWIEANASNIDSQKYFIGLMERVFGKRDAESLDALSLYLSDSGWNLLSRKQVYMFYNTINDINAVSSLSYYLNNIEGFIAVQNNGYVYCLVDLDQAKPLQDIPYILNSLEELNCIGVGSYIFENINDLLLQLEISETALKTWINERDNQKNNERIVDCVQYLFRYLVRYTHSTCKRFFYHPAIAAIQEYDQTNQTQLLYTLYRFLANDRNYAKTAQEMFLHRNTVQYRIERLQDFFSLDLDNIELRLHLLISLYELFECK